jgi:hypothetical protein
VAAVIRALLERLGIRRRRRTTFYRPTGFAPLQAEAGDRIVVETGARGVRCYLRHPDGTTTDADPLP